jgi:hypothetical protein
LHPLGFDKNFFYGKRSDMSFKFLAKITPEDAATFIQELFTDTIDALDESDFSRVKQRILQGQEQADPNGIVQDYIFTQ